MSETDVRKLSITRNDAGDVRQAGVYYLLMNPQPAQGGLPGYWSHARDWYLRQTLDLESFWAGAVNIAITKMSSLAWDLESPAPRVRNAFQELLLAADANQSWVNFLARHLQDYLCTDNGAFIEVVRATQGAGARILGLMHLDSLRCTRTGDPEIPVLYRDTKGVEHEVRAHQVIPFADMPDSAETWHGVGHCAAARTYRGILKMAAIEDYIYDKVAGKRPRALDIISGVSPNDVETAVQFAREQTEAESPLGKAYMYMGAIVIPTMGDQTITHERIAFSELPDGFDREKEFNIGLLEYANGIGLDPQDLQPLTGASLGTGAQSQVLAEKGKGKGLSSWRQQFTHGINQFVLPDNVIFAFSELDLRDEKQKVDVSSVRGQTVAGYIGQGIVTAAQAAQILADAKDIPNAFVPVDQTPGGTLADTDKPESEAESQPGQEPPAEPTLQTQVKAKLAEFDSALTAFKEAIAVPGKEPDA